MKSMSKNSMDCKTCQGDLAELLLVEGYAAQHAALAEHLEGCVECAQELSALHATFALMDTWTAPEPSAYFDSKVRVGLREAEAAAPEGFWERVRSFVLFSTGRGLRPAMAGALALVMVAAGGGVLIETQHRGLVTPTSATVNDLRILDNNSQALQQMDELLDDNGSDDGTAQPTT
jgi:anti-sigma factor RsiW